MNSSRFLFALVLACRLAVLNNPAGAAPALSEQQQKFREELAAKSRLAEKENAGAITGTDNWLFLASDIRFLSLGQFWGDEARKTARVSKPEAADPMPAIVDFNNQLKQRGIELVLLPVPPKAAIYPEKTVANVDLKGQSAAPFLDEFCAELRQRGINVIDLAPVYLQNRATDRGPLFCRTDSHWSGFGCVLAGQTLAEKLKGKFSGQPHQDFVAEWREAELKGDLAGLAGTRAKQTEPEKIPIRSVTEKNGGALNPDANSPLLVLGDSHTLVFHDFHAERAGLTDQLAAELGFVPDLIGTRGSGATAVRISLYRRSLKDPAYLSKKKVIVWCFAAREFTESDQGWEKVPVAK